METKDIALRLKTIGDAGQFTGIVSVYGAPDLVGDIVEPGAFKQAISLQPTTGYPLLWSHDQSIPLGLARIADSEKALMVSGQIDRADPDGERAYQRLTKGYVKGVSFGYTIPDEPGAVTYDGQYRRLRSVRLHELSLVAIPCQPLAMVTSVKSLASARHLIERLRGKIDGDAILELKAIRAHLTAVLPDDHDDHDDHDALLAELRDLAGMIRT